MVTIIIQSIVFGVSIFKVYTDMQIHLKDHDVRIGTLEKREDDIYEIYTKLEKISEKLNAIEIKLERKQNRE